MKEETEKEKNFDLWLDCELAKLEDQAEMCAIEAQKTLEAFRKAFKDE